MVYSHKVKVVHRDLSPGNILVFDNNVIKVADFRISKQIEKTDKTMITNLGTQGYKAPEMMT